MAKKIFEIEMNLNDAIKQASDLTETIEQLKQAQKQATKGSEEWEIASQSIKIAKQSYNELSKEIQRLTKEQELQNATSKDADELLQKNVQTIAQAEEQNRRINKLKKNLNVNDKEQKKLLDQLNAKLEKNTNFIRENSDAEHRRVLNIGNYKSALEGLNNPMVRQYVMLKNLRKGMLAMTQATSGSSKALKIFKYALASTGLGAILVVFGLLITAFAKTQRGIDAINRALTPLKVIMETLWGQVEKLATVMVDAFIHPKKALISLVDAIKNNLMNRIMALQVMWEGLINLDFGKMADAMLQSATGVENLTEKVKEMASETNKMFDEAYKRGKKIAQLDEQIASMEMARNLVLEKNKTLIKQEELIAKDKTKSEKERLKALQVAQSATKENLNFETDLLRKKIEQLKLNEKNSDTSKEDYKKRLDLEAQLEKKKQEALSVELRFLAVKNQISKEIAKKQTQRLKEYHKKVLENLKNEIENYKLKNAEILENDKQLNDKLVSAKIEVLDHLQALEKQAIDEQYKQKFGIGYQNELAYQNAILQSEQDFNKQKQDLYNQFNEQKNAEEQAKKDAEFQQKQTDLELELQEIELSETAKYDKKLEILSVKKEQEQLQLEQALEKETLTKEQYEKKKSLIEIKYNKLTTEATNKLEEVKTQAKIKSLNADKQMAHQAANIATAIFGKNKIVSSAVALVDTYVAAQKAYLSQMQATPDSPIRAYLAMVSAIAIGLNNVAQINKVNPGSSSGGSGSTPPPRTTPTGAVSLPRPSNTTTPTSQTLQGNIVSGQGSQTVRVINVARDTTDVANNEIMVENYANI